MGPVLQWSGTLQAVGWLGVGMGAELCSKVAVWGGKGAGGGGGCGGAA